VERVLGRISGPVAGPTLVGVGGLHGNETAGVRALQKVLDQLRARSSALVGDLVALSGNRRALEAGQRYLVRDLNRSWTADSLRSAREAGGVADAEDQEQLELLEALDEAVEAARGEVCLLDLHTTSGPAAPFTAIMNTPSNRGFALRFPVPLVLGFGELVDGTFFGYLTNRGITSVVFEGGQHEDPVSVSHCEAAIWLALAAAGLIRPADFPEVAHSRKLLELAARNLPRALEIRYRHPVGEEDGFHMLPGFENFQPVLRSQLLARDREGEVKAPEGGRLLLPLYQAQGDDGFFIIREVALSR
jgi:succinylglutamate desuccinylase